MFFIPVILFLIAVVIFVVVLIIQTTEDSGIFADTPEAAANLEKGKNAILNLDNIFLFIITGLSLFVIISAAIVYNHPAFIIIGIFALAIAILFSATVSNNFWTFANTDALSSIAASFPKITFLMNNLPLYILFIGIASSISGIIGYKRQ